MLWCQQLLQLVLPWCPLDRQTTGPEILLQPDSIFQHISLLQSRTRILHSMLSLASVSSLLVGKCQTLTYVKSCRYVGLLGCNSSHYWVNSSPTACAVLAPDSWNYCFGGQGLTAQHLPLNICLRWLQWIRGSMLPCGRGSKHKLALPYLFFTYINCSALQRRFCNIAHMLGCYALFSWTIVPTI